MKKEVLKYGSNPRLTWKKSKLYSYFELIEHKGEQTTGQGNSLTPSVVFSDMLQ
jgi:hypothetical protein